MAIDYAQLKIDDAAGHPVTGAFNADPQIAAGEWNAINRSAPGGVEGMLYYCIVNRSRSQDGTDTVRTCILSRIHAIADAAVGEDPLGRGAGNEVTLEQKHAAKLFAELMRSPYLLSLDFEDTEVDAAYSALGGAGGAEVWKPADIAALKGLSQNQQSYASELGYGRLRAGDIQFARAN